MPILYLEDIFVSAEYRNHGFGKMLMDHTVSFAIKHDCSRLEWVVESRNISAQMFYKNLGAELRKDLIVSRFDIANS